MHRTWLLGLLIATPVAAKPFTTRDWVWSIGAGTAGGALLGTGGAFLAAKAVGDSPELGGFEDLAAALFIGLPLGLDLGATGAVYGYGQLSGHQGSVLVTLAGGTVGTLAGFGLFALTGFIHERLLPLGVGLGVLCPAVGATVGYRLSQGELDEGPPVSGALLDLNPAVGLRLGMPALAFAPGPEGAYTLALPLFGGRF